MYHFAEPSFAKYTAQFVNTSASYINHIPLTLLVGPAAPLGHATTAHPRYNADMFSTPAPQYIQPDASAVALTEMMDKGDLAAVRELGKMLEMKLSPTGQKEGKAVAFFDQGFMVGGGIVMLPVLTALGYAGVYGVRLALRRWR